MEELDLTAAAEDLKVREDLRSGMAVVHPVNIGYRDL